MYYCNTCLAIMSICSNPTTAAEASSMTNTP